MYTHDHASPLLSIGQVVIQCLWSVGHIVEKFKLLLLLPWKAGKQQKKEKTVKKETTYFKADTKHFASFWLSKSPPPLDK